MLLEKAGRHRERRGDVVDSRQGKAQFERDGHLPGRPSSFGFYGCEQGDMHVMVNMRNNKVALGRLIFLCALIFGFVNMPQGAVNDLPIMLLFPIIGLISIVLIVVKYLHPDRSSPNIYVELAYYLIVFVLSFSVVYWNYGSLGNFNIQLTRLDAVYFTIGTLSTAGTGNIVTTSEIARTLQGSQMLLDLGVFSVAVTLVITRLSSLGSGSK